ncbi:MAG: hypothetical protein H7831_13185 [Magnetococcus sp. WYHC-3]
MRLPNKCLIDTNVPKIANLATMTNAGFPYECILECINAVEYVIKTSGPSSIPETTFSMNTCGMSLCVGSLASVTASSSGFTIIAGACLTTSG